MGINPKFNKKSGDSCIYASIARNDIARSADKTMKNTRGE